jgi:hypothetical protein
MIRIHCDKYPKIFSLKYIMQSKRLRHLTRNNSSRHEVCVAAGGLYVEDVF